MFLRRHHCRRCGRSLCQRHAADKSPIVAFGQYKPVSYILTSASVLICIHACVSTHMCVSANMHARVCMHCIGMRAHAQFWLLVCTDRCMHAYTHISHICIHVFTHAHTRVCINAFTHGPYICQQVPDPPLLRVLASLPSALPSTHQLPSPTH